MPVYNAGKYLNAAIESVLQQTFGDFEFLIFNDASTDNSLDIIQSYADNRIVLINSGVNKGYLEHLNHGIRMARGKYIARMDADDISSIHRFEKQVALLDAHEEIGVCGSWATLIREDNDGKDSVVGIAKKPSTHADILDVFYKENPFFHSSVMLRRSLLVGQGLYYDQDYYTSEDYHLWYLLSARTRLHIIEEPLLQYRLHPGNISKTRNDLQTINANRVRADILSDQLQLNLSEEEKKSLYLFLSLKKIGQPDFGVIGKVVKSITEAKLPRNKKKELLTFMKLRFIWYINTHQFGLSDAGLLRHSGVYKFGIKNVIKYAYKCIFRV